MNVRNVERIETAIRSFLEKNGQVQWQHVKSLVHSIETSVTLDAISADEIQQAKSFFDSAVWGK